jgi:hypothetical protein
MKKFIRANAINLFLGLLSMVIVFHVFILTKIIPYTIAWGGRLENDAEMYVFELISIAINLLIMFVLALKAGYLTMKVSEKILDIVLWIFFFLFCLNTLGNLLAETIFEKSFSVLTAISALFIWIILRKK